MESSTCMAKPSGRSEAQPNFKMHTPQNPGSDSVLALLLLVEFALLLCSSILVLLVLRNQIVHVALSLSELHLVHSLASVPMQERLATEHRREVLSNTLEHLLDGRRIPRECHRHLQALRGDVAHGGL